MRHRFRWIAGPAIVSVLLLSACTTVVEESSAGSGGAQIEAIKGTDLVRILMTDEAVKRLDMKWAPVRDTGKAAGSSKVIPYAAVFYGPTGDTWTYTSLDSMTFQRAPIAIDRIEGDRAFLSDGPPSGTAVVTRGAAELFGIETGVDES
jgi:hypothetical protein